MPAGDFTGWPGESNGTPKPKDKSKVATPEACPLCGQGFGGKYTDHIREECEGAKDAAGGELVTDGGREEIRACPECESGDVYPKSGRNEDVARSYWRCQACGETFDEPEWRERRRPQYDRTRSPHANALLDADPDDYPELVTDGGTDTARQDRDVLADLDEGDDVQFTAETDDGRRLVTMHHGHVTRVLGERKGQARIDVAPHSEDDLDLASNVRNRDRLRLRGSEQGVTVYSLNHDGARGYILGTTDGTLTTPDMGGGSKVLVADGGEPEGAIDNTFDDAERSARDQLAERNAEFQRQIDPGDVVIDLVTRQPLYVLRAAAKSIDAYYEGEDFDLLNYKQAPYLPVRMSDAVYECVFIPGLDGLHKLDQTYDYPAGRLARVPIERAMGGGE